MHDIKIDPEIANLCRPLTEDEKAQLEANLKVDGCIDALKLWGDILLDGHNRLEICKRLGLPFNAERVNVHDRHGAINWVIANQLGRRNLIPEDASYLRGKRYHAEKLTHSERVKRAVAARGAEKQTDVPRHEPGQTRRRLADEFGVAGDTLAKDALFANAVDKIEKSLGKEVSGMIRTGKSGLGKKDIIEFGKNDVVTIQKFNDLRFERQQRRAAQQKQRKKSAPKHGLSQLKRAPNALDTTEVERMRPFMNALIQIATTPVTAKTLASDRWPSAWRKQILESLPPALAFLKAFGQEFTPEGDG